ncbi:hypothetical protein OG689_02170 [Kitasatospora sp. NBC_00240]|uniref:hypothetical protein n=1 Tax=Kitasatospora sp. NBC_00240 TaxID=2903567 RepID=UPI00225895E8|nr:hypothetical protein [Kitasatospora sp. NBC_00240]MCX5208127.1 hypothetical protein [Kitasatospora sp. NBC_00240]
MSTGRRPSGRKATAVRSEDDDSLAADGAGDDVGAEGGQRAVLVDPELVEDAVDAGLDVEVPAVLGGGGIDGARVVVVLPSAVRAPFRPTRKPLTEALPVLDA